MILEGKTALVTGGTGFIGGRLVEKLVLEQRCRVRVLVRNFAKASRIAAFPVELVPGAITDRDALESAIHGCDLVFHCAHDFTPDLEGQRRANVEATRNLAELCLEEKVSRLVYLSSVATYSPATVDELTESSPWPASEDAYVLVKRDVERLLRDLHEEKGVPAVTLQPTIVYGPFSTFWTLHPVQRLLSGVVPLVDGGAGICNAVYVDDLVDSMILAAAHPDVTGEKFLISAEKPVTWKMFYQALERAIGVQSTVEMSEAEIRSRIRDRERRSRIAYRVMRRLRSPATWAQLGKVSAVKAAAKIVPDAALEAAAKRWLEHDSRKTVVVDGRARPLALPGPASLQAEKSRSRARIDKAKARLGYTPRFDLERGMDITRRYLEWANVTNNPEAPSAGPTSLLKLASRN